MSGKRGLLWFTLAIVFFVVAILLVGIIVGINILDRDYKFQYYVHSHCENAYWAADPATMKTELLAAEEGMRSLGLTSDMYSKWLPWEKTPNNRMSWQYAHWESIINRTNEFMAWEKAQNETGSQQMQDVYSQKLDNVRSFIRQDTWSDWIAQDAWAINFYFVTSVILPWVAVVSLILMVIFGIFWLAS